VGHGSASPDDEENGSPGGVSINEVLALEQQEQLTLTQLAGLPDFESGIGEAEPLVFINACEVGRAVPALTGIGGFAAAFIDMGATAVIAPLWSVKDDIAHTIALEFYGKVLESPSTPLSSILRDIRARAYDDNGEDTYAAYCFFGDPLLHCSVPEASGAEAD
jgi:hypothetical protein